MIPLGVTQPLVWGYGVPWITDSIRSSVGNLLLVGGVQEPDGYYDGSIGLDLGPARRRETWIYEFKTRFCEFSLPCTDDLAIETDAGYLPIREAARRGSGIKARVCYQPNIFRSSGLGSSNYADRDSGRVLGMHAAMTGHRIRRSGTLKSNDNRVSRRVSALMPRFHFGTADHGILRGSRSKQALLQEIYSTELEKSHANTAVSTFMNLGDQSARIGFLEGYCAPFFANLLRRDGMTYIHVVAPYTYPQVAFMLFAFRVLSIYPSIRRRGSPVPKAFDKTDTPVLWFPAQAMERLVKIGWYWLSTHEFESTETDSDYAEVRKVREVRRPSGGIPHSRIIPCPLGTSWMGVLV